MVRVSEVQHATRLVGSGHQGLFGVCRVSGLPVSTPRSSWPCTSTATTAQASGLGLEALRQDEKAGNHDESCARDMPPHDYKTLRAKVELSEVGGR